MAPPDPLTLGRSPLSRWLTEDPPPPNWLVPGVLPAGRMIILAGAPGAGKSFLSYTLALAAATGRPFLTDSPLSPFRTVYFDEENAPEDTAEYLRWAWNGLLRPPVAQIEANLWHFGLQLLKQPTSAEVYRFMVAAVTAHQPKLIVIDTATPCCRILDENDNAEASQAIRMLRLVRNAAGPDATMLILKHLRINQELGTKDVRGAKAWSGEADGVLFQHRIPGRPQVLLGRDFATTRLQPHKIRAFGLGYDLRITPAEVGGGIALAGAPWEQASKHSVGSIPPRRTGRFPESSDER